MFRQSVILFIGLYMLRRIGHNLKPGLNPILILIGLVIIFILIGKTILFEP
jgi:hypothetical protein